MMNRGGSLILTQGAKHLHHLTTLKPMAGSGTGSRLSGGIPSDPPGGNSFLSMPSRGVGNATRNQYDKNGVYIGPQTMTQFNHGGVKLPMPELLRNLPQGCVLVDLGSGTGTHIPNLVAAAHNAGGKVVAIEKDRASAEGIARKAAGSVDKGLPEFGCVSVEQNTPLALAKLEGKADYIQAVRVAPYIENKKAFIADLVSALKPGGVAYVDFYHPTLLTDNPPHSQHLFEFADDADLANLQGAHVEAIAVEADIRSAAGKPIVQGRVAQINPADLFSPDPSSVAPDKTIRDAINRYPDAAVRDVRVQLVIRRDPEPRTEAA